MIPSQLARSLDLATTNGDVMLFNLLKYSSPAGKGIHVPIYLKEAFDVHRGMREVPLGSTACSQTSREQKHHYVKRLADKNDVVCLQETRGKEEFVQALQELHSHLRMFGKFIPDNVNAGGSAILIHKGLLPDHAVIAHETTQQERDHVIRIRTDESAPVITNVHLEPGVSMRNLRERLRRIAVHWPRHPEGFGFIIGDFNKCEPEGRRFNVMNQTFSEGNAVRTAVFRSFFPHAPEIAQPIVARKDASADRTLRTSSSIDRALINVPVA